MLETDDGKELVNLTIEVILLKQGKEKYSRLTSVGSVLAQSFTY